MKKWNLLFTVLFTTIFLTLCEKVKANEFDKNLTPFEWRQYGQWVEFEADWLYWKPSIDNLDLAASVTQNGSGREVKYKNLNPDWHNGFRVSLWFPDVCRGWNASSSYSRMHLTNSKRQHYPDWNENNGIISPLTFKGDGFSQTWERGSESLDLLYQDWDLLISYTMRCRPCHMFTPYFGVAGLYLHQEEEGNFSIPYLVGGRPQTVNVEWTLDFSGVGLKVGTKYEYSLTRTISFYSDANFSLLESSDTIVNTQTQNPGETITVNDSQTNHQVYGYHFGAGFTMNRCFCAWNYKVRLGYEFINWYNLPNHRVFFGNNTGSGVSLSSPPRTRGLGFNGLVAGCSMVF